MLAIRARMGAWKQKLVASFDGVDDYIDYGHVLSDVFDARSPWSLSYWALYKPSDYAPTFSKYNTSTPTGIHLQDASGRFRAGDGIGNVLQAYLFDGYIGGTGWRLVSLIYDGDNFYTYVDNTLKSTTPWEYGIGDTSNINLYIGKNDWGNYFEGNIKDVRIYNSALSSSEVTALYSGTAPTSGLVASYPLGGNALDYAGVNDGTVFGTTFEDAILPITWVAE